MADGGYLSAIQWAVCGVVLSALEKSLGSGTPFNGRIISGPVIVVILMKNSKYILTVCCTLVLISVASSVFAQSCPMCKEAMSSAGKKLSDGFYYSIISMAFLPMSLVAGGAIFVIRSSYVKRHPDTALSTFGIIREVVKGRFGKQD